MHLVLASYLTPVFSSYSCPVIHVSCLPSNIFTHNELYLVGGFNPSEHISQWEGLSHILWKIKNDPNHQPDIYIYIHITVSTIETKTTAGNRAVNTQCKWGILIVVELGCPSNRQKRG